MEVIIISIRDKLEAIKPTPKTAIIVSGSLAALVAATVLLYFVVQGVHIDTVTFRDQIGILHDRSVFFGDSATLLKIMVMATAAGILAGAAVSGIKHLLAEKMEHLNEKYPQLAAKMRMARIAMMAAGLIAASIALGIGFYHISQLGIDKQWVALTAPQGNYVVCWTTGIGNSLIAGGAGGAAAVFSLHEGFSLLRASRKYVVFKENDQL